MNVLFLSLLDFDSIDERNIYTDLLREFWKNDHKLYVVSPVERRSGKEACVLNTDKAVIVKPLIYDMQKVGYIQKAFSMFTIEPILIRTIRRTLSEVKFDLVLYATPPITFQRAVSYVKHRDGATTYLLQKDIFPEGLLDLQVLTLRGWNGWIYKYYRRKEIKLLKTSDYIGCMSQANIDYIRKHNTFLDPSHVELCPNSIEVVDKSISENEKRKIRQKYELPLDKRVFVYGGNLGKPQGIPFLIECLKRCKDLDGAFFLIVGDGTEYSKIEDYLQRSKQQNVKLMKRIPTSDYDKVVAACDVGLIFLDHRFTIPNFPSRLLGYMQARLPVLAATDPNSDIGNVITENSFGWWIESDRIDAFISAILEICSYDLREYGENSFKFLSSQYDVRSVYKSVINHIDGEK